MLRRLNYRNLSFVSDYVRRAFNRFEKQPPYEGSFDLLANPLSTFTKRQIS